jgi:hypothetical protein
MLEFPKDKVEYAIFSGIEQEGVFKGISTYFIVGDVPLQLILDVCKEAEHLYFGAGGRFDYNPDTVLGVLENLEVLPRVTVESPILDMQLFIDLQDILKDNFLWHLPIMWHGQACTEGLNSLKVVDQELDGRNLALKIDTGYSTYSKRLSDFPYSHYNDYSGDQLLVQKDKE